MQSNINETSSVQIEFTFQPRQPLELNTNRFFFKFVSDAKQNELKLRLFPAYTCAINFLKSQLILMTV